MSLMAMLKWKFRLTLIQVRKEKEKNSIDFFVLCRLWLYTQTNRLWTRRYRNQWKRLWKRQSGSCVINRQKILGAFGKACLDCDETQQTTKSIIADEAQQRGMKKTRKNSGIANFFFNHFRRRFFFDGSSDAGVPGLNTIRTSRSKHMQNMQENYY